MTFDPEAQLAPYAVRSADSRGRVHPEPPDPLRPPFDLDRHRIMECTAFRRLEQKTQVFAPDFHDHFRTRLTHTLEVANVARTLARSLRVNESLVEAIALAHDLGHPPFGHAGEAALHEVMAPHGGFNHNTHALRVLEYLEHPFPPFRGLNLTHETRDGLREHETPYDRPETVEGHGASVEARIVSLADRVVYNGHDLEDAIGAGLVTLEDLSGVPLWRLAWQRTNATGAATIHAVRRQVLDALLDLVLDDVIRHARSGIDATDGDSGSAGDEPPFVAPSPQGNEWLRELEDFLRRVVYRHPRIVHMDREGQRMITRLFEAYRTRPEALPERFAARIDAQGIDRVTCDYIAGMTDRFCLGEFQRLCG